MALNKIVYNESEIYEEVNGINKQNKPVMYIAKVIKDDFTTNINTIHIVSGALKQYSYELLKKVTEARQRMIDADNDTKLIIKSYLSKVLRYGILLLSNIVLKSSSFSKYALLSNMALSYITMVLSSANDSCTISLMFCNFNIAS